MADTLQTQTHGRSTGAIVTTLAIVTTALLVAGCGADPGAPSSEMGSTIGSQDELLRWPLPPGAEAYSDIDQDVPGSRFILDSNDQSCRIDEGHPDVHPARVVDQER